MARHTVEEVFVLPDGGGELVTGALSPAATTDILSVIGSATALQYGFMDAETNLVVDASALTAATAPRSLKFFTFDAVRGYRFSQTFSQGEVSMVRSRVYSQPTPIAYNLAFANIGDALAGDKIWLQINLTNEFDYKMHKIPVQHTFFSAGTQTDIDEITAKINSSIVQLYPNFYPVRAFSNGSTDLPTNMVVPAGEIHFVMGRPQPDQTGIVQAEIYDAKIFLMGSYQASTNTTFELWNAIFTTGLTLTTGSILAPVYSGTNRLTSVTAPGFSTNSATNGSGHPYQVQSHYYQALGQLGVLNRVIFETMPNNPVVSTIGYDTLNIEFDSKHRMPGESPELTNQPKTITIYMPNTTNLAAPAAINPELVVVAATAAGNIRDFYM